MLLRYPFSIAVVALAFAVSGGIFLFLRPEYSPEHGRTIDLSGYPAAAHGWTWRGGTPGFVVRTGREDWNVSRVRPSELPRGARLLAAQRNGDALSLLLARGKCIGAGTASGLTWFCPPVLHDKLAFVLVDAVPTAGDVYSINLVAATRAEVRRVVVRNPEILRRVHRDNSVTIRYGEGRTALPIDGNWGTFAYSLADGYRPDVKQAKPWRVRLDFYGKRGWLRSERVALAKPGTQLLVVY